MLPIAEYAARVGEFLQGVAIVVQDYVVTTHRNVSKLHFLCERDLVHRSRQKIHPSLAAHAALP